MKITVCLVFLILTCVLSQTDHNHKETRVSDKRLPHKPSKPQFRRQASSVTRALPSDDEIKEYFQMPDKSDPKISSLVTRVKQRYRRPRMLWQGHTRNSANARRRINAIKEGLKKPCNNDTVTNKPKTEGRLHHAKKHPDKHIRTPADEGRASRDRIRARLDQRGLKESSRNDSKITVSIGAVKTPRNRRRWVRLGQYRPVAVYPQNVRYYPVRWPAYRQNSVYSHNSQANGNPRSVSATTEALAILTQKLSKMEADMARLRETVLRQGAAHIRSSERIEAMLTAQTQQTAKNGEDTQEALKSIKHCCAGYSRGEAEAESVHREGEETTPTNQPLRQHGYKSKLAAISAKPREGSPADNLDDLYSDKNNPRKQYSATDAVTSSTAGHTSPLPQLPSDQQIPTRNYPSQRDPPNKRVPDSGKTKKDISSDKNEREIQHTSEPAATGLETETQKNNDSMAHDHRDSISSKEHADSGGRSPSPEQFTDLRVSDEVRAQLTNKTGLDESQKHIAGDRSDDIEKDNEEIRSAKQSSQNLGSKVSRYDQHAIDTTVSEPLDQHPTLSVPKQGSITVMPSDTSKDTEIFASDDPNVHVLRPSQESHLQSVMQPEHGDKNDDGVSSLEPEDDRPKDGSKSSTQAIHNQKISPPLVDANARTSESEKEVISGLTTEDLTGQPKMPVSFDLDTDRYAAAKTWDIDQLPTRAAELVPHGLPDSYQSGTIEHARAESWNESKDSVLKRERSNTYDLNQQETSDEAGEDGNEKALGNSNTPFNVSGQDSQTEEHTTEAATVIVNEVDNSAPTTQQDKTESKTTTPLTVETDKYVETSTKLQQTTPPLIVRTLSSWNVKFKHGAQSLTNPEFQQQSHDYATRGLHNMNGFVFSESIGNHMQVTEKENLGEVRDSSLSSPLPTGNNKQITEKTTVEKRDGFLTKHHTDSHPSEKTEDATVTKHLHSTTLSTTPQSSKTQHTEVRSTPAASSPAVPVTATVPVQRDTHLDVNFHTGDIQNDGMPGVTWIVRPSRPLQRSRWPIRLTRSAARTRPESDARGCSMQGVLKFTFTPPAKSRRHRHHYRRRYRHHHRRRGGDDNDEEQEEEEESGGGGRRKLLLNMEFQNPKQWVFNLGDSIANNGFSGDGLVQENDCEAQGYGTTFAVYGSDKHPDGRQKLLRLDNSFIVHNVTLVVSDESLHWNNHQGTEGELKNSSLFALSGQSDRQGTVNYDVYLGLNRVIDGSYRSGHGLCRLSARWLD